MHPRVRDSQVGLVHPIPVVGQDVDVYRPRAPSFLARPPELDLDLQTGLQELPGRERRLALDDGVQVVRLRRTADGVGLVYAGGPSDVDVDAPREQVDGALQV